MSRFTRCNCPAGVSAQGERHAPDCPSYSGITAPMAAMMAVSKLRPIAMTEQTELLPCPFCGEQVKPPVSRPSSTDMSDGYVAFVACFCGGYSATAHRMGCGETEQEAVQEVIAKWNFRAKPSEQWVPVSERLPDEHHSTVAVLFDDGQPGVAWATYWHGARSGFAEWTFPVDELGEDRIVTHWMPLPPSPNGGT